MIKTFLDDFKIYMHKKMLVIMLLGFSSGLPLLLVFSTLSLWLSESGVDLAVIGYISMVRAPYSFKFLWAPIVDRVNIPFLTKLFGRRRSWALFTQILLIFSLIGIAFTVPSTSSIIMTVICAFLVAFCSASQDIVVDAYRIEASKTSELGATSAAYQLGYRIGMIIAGAGALYLADFFEKSAFSLMLFGQKLTEWNITYLIMAAFLMIGVFTTIFLAKEPNINENLKDFEEKTANLTFFAKVKNAFVSAVIAPFADFIKRPYWLLIILFIMIYKLPDSYIGPMAMPFYDELGFSKAEIATIQKIYGVIFTIIGTVIGGIIVSRIGIIKSLFFCGILMAVSNFAFAWLALQGHNQGAFILAIALENISGGMSLSAYVAYLSSLCSVAFTATQYALFTSIMGFGRDVIAASSGIMASSLGWFWFFNITVLMVIPSLIILYFLVKRMPTKL